MDQANLQSALDLFINADDSSVGGVVVSGRGIYGEKDLLTSLDQGIYSQYAGTPEALGSKYFRIPDIFGETSLQKLWQDYNTIIQNGDINFSQIRTSENDFYIQEMDDLVDEFSVSTH